MKNTEKIKLIGSLGLRGCEACGKRIELSINYPSGKNLEDFHFHHLVPELKSFNIGNRNLLLSFPEYMEEAKKCSLLCSSCHKKIHKRGESG